MQLLENKSPFYTLKHLAALQEYGKNCLGLNISEKEICEQKDKIMNGTPDIRSALEAVVYEVIDDTGEYAGDIIITDGEENYKEISILIFTEKQGNKIALKSLKMAITILADKGFNKVEAIIRNTNPFRERVIVIFEELGFNMSEKFEDNVLYRKA